MDSFDWERDMARLATLPRQAEREAYISQFQGCSADARSDEKWQLIGTDILIGRLKSDFQSLRLFSLPINSTLKWRKK